MYLILSRYLFPDSVPARHQSDGKFIDDSYDFQYVPIIVKLNKKKEQQTRNFWKIIMGFCQSDGCGLWWRTLGHKRADMTLIF